VSNILDKEPTMTFPLKSAITTIGALILVYGGYFAILSTRVDDDAIRQFAYKPLLVLSAVAVAMLMAMSHGVLAALSPSDANAYDERDRQIGWRSSRIGSYVMAVGVFAVLVLVLYEAEHFYIANALLLVWVLAELADQLAKVYFYAQTN
jgi:uncharacterized membrane protein